MTGAEFSAADVPHWIVTLGSAAGAIAITKMFIDFMRELSQKFEAIQRAQVESQHNRDVRVEDRVEAIIKATDVIVTANTDAIKANTVSVATFLVETREIMLRVEHGISELKGLSEKTNRPAP